MKKVRPLSYFVISIFAFIFLNALSVFAGPTRTTYQAKIIKPDGYPLESTTVNFKFTILDPAGSCILYSETFSNVNMGSSAGLVSFALGTGVRTFPVVGSNFEQVFSNTTASLTCDSGGPATYSPSANDTRKIVMQFNDSTGWQTLPAMTINAVPYAMYANDSLKFSGKDVTDFVQTASVPTCGASEAIRFNGAGFSCIAAGGTGTITSGSVTTALGYTPADGASVTAVTSTVNSVSSTVASVSSTVYSVSSTVTSLQNSVAASFAAITSSQWSTIGADIYYGSRVGIGTSSPSALLDVGGWSEAPAGLANGANITGNLYVGNTGSNIARTRLSSNVNGGFLQWNRLLTASGVVQSDITKPSFNFEMNGTTDRFIFQRSAASSTTLVDLMSITGSGRVGIGVSTPVTALEVSGGIRIGSDSSSCTADLAGTLRYNAGVVEYCNGTTWAAFGVSGAGILAINGLVSGSQTFAFGNSGTAPNVSSTGSVHTFNFPYASVATTTAGVISYSDYLNFSNKQSATSAAIAATLGYTPADAVSLTTLSSTVGSVSSAVNTVSSTVATLSSTVNSVSSAVNSVSSTVASVSSTVNSVSSSVASLQNAMAASFGAITSSQWITSGTGIFYNTGNVGIGASSPAEMLHLNAATGVLRSGFRTSWTDTNAYGEWNAYEGATFMGGISVFGSTYATSAYRNAFMMSAANNNLGSLIFRTRTGGTYQERMNILNNGYVGIGTSAPAVALDVVGAVRVSPNAGASTSVELGHTTYGSLNPGFSTATGGYIQGPLNASLVVDIKNNHNDDAFAIRYSAANSGNVDSIGMVLNGQGRVGIGTSAPTQRLEVDGFISSINTSDNSASRSVRIGMVTDATNAANSFGNGDPWLVLDGGTNAGSATLQILGNQNRTLNVRLHDGSLFVPYGNVGVGLATSAPASRLHVADNNAVIMTLERQNNQNSLIEYKNTLGSVYAGQITGTTDFGVGTGNDLGASANLRVTNTGRVYIGGTTAPTARLHITAGTSAVAAVKLTSGTLLATPQAGAIEYDGTDYYITDNSNVRRTIATASTGGVLNNTSVVSSTSGITLWPAAGNSVVVSSTVASTNSTTGALIVNGGAGIAGALNVGGIISGSAIIKGTGYRANQGAPDAADSSTVGYAFGSDGDTGIFSPGTGSANGVLAFYSNNSEKMRVNNNGLGIGTSPSLPLDVMTTGSLTQRLYYVGNSQYDDANLILARSRGTSTTPTAVQSGDAIGGVYFRGHDGSNISSSSAYIAVSAEENFTGSTKGTSMKFGSTVAGTGSYQEIMRIHSNGFVGIGNTTPNALLQVGPSGSQPANYNIYLASYRSTAGQGQLVGNWAGTDYWGLGPATNSTTDNTLRLGNTTDRTGTWAGTQNLNLVMGGALAVGSATVGTYAFQAVKNFNGISSQTAAFIGGTDAGSSGSGIYVMQKDNTNLGANTSFLLNAVHNNVSKFAVTGLGNVGVGTSAPTEKLQIENTTGQANILVKGMNGATSTRAEVKLDRYDNPRGGGVRILDTNTGGAQWWSGVPYNGGGATDIFTIGRHATQPEYLANALLTVTSAGDVGIGTTAPAVMLTVDDTGGTVSAPYIAATDKLAVMSTGNGVIQITTPASNSAAIYFSDPQSRDPGGVAYSHLTDSMSFRVNQSTRMTINASGALGLGTATPYMLLHLKNTTSTSDTVYIDRADTTPNLDIYSSYNVLSNVQSGTFAYGVRPSDDQWQIWERGFNAAWTNLFTVTKTGNVGVGTASPIAPLEVVGAITTKGGEIIMQRPAVGGGWARGLHYTPDGSTNATASGLAGIGLLGSGSTQTSIYLAFGASPWASSNGMHILANGNVGVGLTNPTALFHVNGAALATAWNTSSDKRLKENIKPIENSVGKILQLRGVEFDWRKDVEAPTKHEETHDIGVIAQEVEKVFPEAVTTPKTGFKSVAYSKLVAPLIEAVKSLYHRILGVEAQQVEQTRAIASKADQQALDLANAKIQKLESENAAKEKEIQEMKLRLEKIEKALNSK